MEKEILELLNKYVISGKMSGRHFELIDKTNFNEIAKKLNDLFALRSVGSTLKVEPLRENAQTLTKKIHELEDSYINADECNNESDKKYIGKELKRLRKLRDNL